MFRYTHTHTHTNYTCTGRNESVVGEDINGIQRFRLCTWYTQFFVIFQLLLLLLLLLRLLLALLLSVSPICACCSCLFIILDSSQTNAFLMLWIDNTKNISISFERMHCFTSLIRYSRLMAINNIKPKRSFSLFPTFIHLFRSTCTKPFRSQRSRKNTREEEDTKQKEKREQR